MIAIMKIAIERGARCINYRAPAAMFDAYSNMQQKRIFDGVDVVFMELAFADAEQVVA